MFIPFHYEIFILLISIICEEKYQYIWRFYSDYIEDKLLDSYTLSKQYAEKDEEKVLKINSFCKRHEISSKLFGKIMNALDRNGVIGTNYRTIHEIEIDI